MWKKILFTLFCIVYGVLLTGTLLVLRFPEERLLDHAAQAVERRLPGYSVSIGDVGYRFPLDLSFNRVRLINPAEIVDVSLEEVLVSLERSNPASRAQVRFDVFGGTVETEVVLDRAAGRIELVGLSAEFRPGFTTLYKGHQVSINSDGFRGPERDRPARSRWT